MIPGRQTAGSRAIQYLVYCLVLQESAARAATPVSAIASATESWRTTALMFPPLRPSHRELHRLRVRGDVKPEALMSSSADDRFQAPGRMGSHMGRAQGHRASQGALVAHIRRAVMFPAAS